MIEESKYCTDIMEKVFNKELVMTKKEVVDLKGSTKSWICDNVYVDGDVTVRDHCHVTGKCRGSAQWDCNIKIKLNKKIHVVFHNLKSNNFHLMMQELGKFNFKIKSHAKSIRKIYKL